LASSLETPAAAADLISFLKALPDCRMRRGVRFPQWWMLLVAILAILSGQGSLLGMERFAKRHRKALNELLGTHVAKPPSDSTFRLLLAQLDVEGFEAMLQQWMAAQPGVTDTVETLVCDGKTLRGSIDQTAAGAARFIAQVSLYSNSLVWPLPRAPMPRMPVARSRHCASCSIALSSRGCWCRRTRCMPTALFRLPRAAGCRLPDCGQTQSPQRISGD
jgi:DDE_Tnp_1-associated